MSDDLPHVDDIPHMDIAEFHEQGFLQEVNRRFFHPLGLALEIVVEEDGSKRLGGIWDFRDEDEGMYYGSDMLSADKADHVDEEWAKHLPARKARGWTDNGVQWIPR